MESARENDSHFGFFGILAYSDSLGVTEEIKANLGMLNNLVRSVCADKGDDALKGVCCR